MNIRLDGSVRFPLQFYLSKKQKKIISEKLQHYREFKEMEAAVGLRKFLQIEGQ